MSDPVNLSETRSPDTMMMSDPVNLSETSLKESAVPMSSCPDMPTTSNFMLRLYFSGILITSFLATSGTITIASVNPLDCSILRGCQTRGQPATGSRHFGFVHVRSVIRDPFPAAITTAWTDPVIVILANLQQMSLVEVNQAIL